MVLSLIKIILATLQNPLLHNHSNYNDYNGHWKNAKNDLAKIVRYIAKDSPPRVEKFVIELISAVNNTLTVFPLSCPIYNKKLNVRRFAYQKYNIYYRYDETPDTAHILQVVNSAKMKNIF
jgi:plasmid stabilization system protein ParE